MTIFADQFAAVRRAKVNSVATWIGGHSPELHLINGLFDCRRSYVPVLPFAAPVPVAETDVDVAGDLR